MSGGVIAGIDIGGTAIKFGAAYENGEAIENLSNYRLTKLDSNVQQGPDATLEQIGIALDRIRSAYVNSNEISAIGLSNAGQANRDGLIKHSVNYGSAWDGISIRQIIEERFGIRTFYENDANAAAIAEYNELFNEIQKHIAGALYTVGTGLGVGIISDNGEIQRGANGEAGESGHEYFPEQLLHGNVKVSEIEEACGCGETGHVEQYANLMFIERELKFAMKKSGAGHALYNDCQEDSREAAKKVLALAGKGDDLCTRIVMDQAKNLGVAIVNRLRSQDPGWIIIGGGITEATEKVRSAYMNNLIQVTKDISPGSHNSDRMFRFAKLGNHAGWYGAAVSASQQIAQ